MKNSSAIYTSRRPVRKNMVRRTDLNEKLRRMRQYVNLGGHLPFDERMTFDEGLDIVLQILLGDVGFDETFNDVYGDEFRTFESGALYVMRVAFLDFHRQVLFPTRAAIGVAARNPNWFFIQRDVIGTDLTYDEIWQGQPQRKLPRQLRKSQLLRLRLDGMWPRRGKSGIYV